MDIPKIKAKGAALLVMDFQSGIINNLPNLNELLAKAKEAIKVARERGVTIGFVRVAMADEDYDKLSQHNKMFQNIAQNPAFHADAAESQVHGEIAPEPDDIVVRKNRVGAFSTTNLAEQLKAKDIHTLILAGVATGGVVLSTVRDAADHDYAIYVLEDASADNDPEVHRVLMEKVFPRQAHVIKVSDLNDLLE